MRKKIRVFIVAVTIVGGFVVLAPAAQQGTPAGQGNTPRGLAQAASPDGSPQRQRARFEPVTGTVATVGVDQLQIKTKDGKTLTVKISGRTRFRDGQQEIQLEDVKPGDTVSVIGRAGEPDVLTAFMVRKGVSGEMARFQNGNRTFGRIVSIKGDEVNVENPLQGQQISIEVTSQTAFSRDGQTITLKDLKVGDGIMAIGERKDGKFVAQRVLTGNMRGRGGQGRGSPGGLRQE